MINNKDQPKKLKKIPDSKLDDLWALIIKYRDGRVCQVCGSSSSLNAHHIFSRNNHSARWLLENGITLCVSHHTFSKTLSAHQAPTEFVEWLKEHMGEVQYNLVRSIAKKPAIKQDKEAIFNNLKEMAKIYGVPGY